MYVCFAKIAGCLISSSAPDADIAAAVLAATTVVAVIAAAAVAEEDMRTEAEAEAATPEGSTTTETVVMEIPVVVGMMIADDLQIVLVVDTMIAEEMAGIAVVVMMIDVAAMTAAGVISRNALVATALTTVAVDTMTAVDKQSTVRLSWLNGYDCYFACYRPAKQINMLSFLLFG